MGNVSGLWQTFPPGKKRSQLRKIEEAQMAFYMIKELPACRLLTVIRNCTWAKNEMKEFFCLCHTCSIMHDNESVWFFSVNSWSSFSVKEPLLTAKNTVFFKIVELAYTQGTVLYVYYISCIFIFILF